MQKTSTVTPITIIPCAGIILMKDDQTVLVRTKRGHHSFPKGKRKKGETYFETATREFVEETNIPIDDITILDNVFIDGLSVRGNPNVRYFLATFNHNIDEMTFSFDPDELEHVAWYPKNEVFALDKFLPDRKMVFKKALEIFEDQVPHYT